MSFCGVERLLIWCLWLGVLLKSVVAEEPVVWAVVEAAWAKDVSRALSCEYAVQDSKAVITNCARDSQVQLVHDASNASEWLEQFRVARDVTEENAPNRTQSAILMAVGNLQTSDFDHEMNQELSTISEVFERVIAVRTTDGEEPELAPCIDASRWVDTGYLECSFFQRTQATFLAAAGASLLPWTRKVFAVLTDHQNVASSDAAYKAFLNGVTYIDPEVSVVRFEWQSEASLGSAARYQGLKMELAHILEVVSVVLLDLQFTSDVDAALRIMQENHESHHSSPSRAILMPNFEGFDADGVVQDAWQSVFMNQVMLDVERGVAEALEEPTESVRYFSFTDGYVSTLWLRQASDVSRWPIERAGNLPESVTKLLEQPCGGIDIQTFLNETVLVPLQDHGSIVNSQPCLVATKCCELVASPLLHPTVELRSPHCTKDICPEEFADQAGALTGCGGGKSFTSRGCPADTDRTTRLIGLGAAVGNVANVDVSTGTFFLDTNIYLFEFNELVDPNDTAAWRQEPDGFCKPSLDLAQPARIENVSDFNKYVTLLSTDRYPTITPTKNGGDLFTNFKGAMYFRPSLKDYPFDKQNLSLVLDATGTTDAVFCILPTFTSLQTDIRFAGISRESLFDVLNLSTTVTQACFAPYAYPDNHCERFSADSRSEGMCEQCVNTTPEDDGRPGDVSCKCMGGAKTSNRAIFQIHYTKPWIRVAFTVFLPPLAITLFNQATLWLKLGASETRTSACSSGLVSTIMYHISVMNNIPSSEQEATRADAVIILCYTGNLFVWFTALGQYVAYNSHHNHARTWANKSFYYKARVFSPVVMIIAVWRTFSTRSVEHSVIGLTAVWMLGAIYMAVDYRRYARRHLGEPEKVQEKRRGMEHIENDVGDDEEALSDDSTDDFISFSDSFTGPRRADSRMVPGASFDADMFATRTEQERTSRRPVLGIFKRRGRRRPQGQSPLDERLVNSWSAESFS